MVNRDKITLLVIALLIGASLWVSFAWPIKRGLDIQGGSHLVVEAQDTQQKIVDNEVVEPAIKVNADVMQAAVAVVRQRVDGLGVAEPLIQLKGERQIIVELPGIDDPQEAVKLVGETAKLDFRRQDPKDKTKWSKPVFTEKCSKTPVPTYKAANGLLNLNSMPKAAKSLATSPRNWSVNP